jgi:hypothetical protein
MKTIEPFGRGRCGKSRIEVFKDRPGHLERPSLGNFVLTSGTDGRCSWRLEADRSVSDDGGFRPTFLMERVSRFIEERVEPPSRSQIEGEVRGKADAIRTAIDRLLLEGYAVEFSGARNARLVRSERPFREEQDEWEDPHERSPG